MSAFGVIRLLTDQLIKNINDAFNAQPETNGILSPHAATSECPATMLTASPPRQGVSFWPYRVSRDEFVCNEPLRPIGDHMLGIPPLEVDVWYLCTPLTGNVENDQWLLEKTLQTVYDMGSMTVGNDNVNVTFETPGADELFRLWSALETPYRLSSIFVARHVGIDSGRELVKASRVLERYDRYTQLVTSP